MPKKTTVKDIAKEANVSTATVSMALSGNTTRVSEQTRKRMGTIHDIQEQGGQLSG